MEGIVSFIRLVVGFCVVALVSTAVLLMALVLLPWRLARIKLCNVYGRLVGRTITWLAGVRPHVQYRERLGGSMPAIYVANHASTLDLFLSIWLCPIGCCGVMKKEIARVPFLGQLAVLSGHLLIDRSNRERAVEALSTTAAYVKAQRLGMWIMPEGTRSQDGRLLPFKKGFVHLAIATGFPVVPVVIHGAHKNWEKGRFRFRPMDLSVEVLPPLDTSRWREEQAGEHALAVHALFAEHLHDEQKPMP